MTRGKGSRAHPLVLGTLCLWKPPSGKALFLKSQRNPGPATLLGQEAWLL